MKKVKNSIAYPVIIVVCLVIAFVALVKAGVIFSSKPSPQKAQLSENRSTNPKTSAPRGNQLPSGSPAPQGTAHDNQGQTNNVSPTPNSSWTSSASGKITLQTPTANSILASGSAIAGTAQTSVVAFSLYDSQVGQIAQGQLNVVNGKFSGTLQFSPHSSTGSLVVYSPNPSNGAEENLIDIPVKFND